MRRVVTLATLLVLALAAPAAADTALKVTPRIVGGSTVAEPTEVPWQALVRHFNEARTGFTLCGGTVIDATHVVTAAHCVLDADGDPLPMSGFEVTAGTLLRSGSGGQSPAVVAVAAHPLYDPDSAYHDAAVITLAEPGFALGGNVVAASLPGPGAPVPAGALTISGWGTTQYVAPDAENEGESSPVLRKSTVKATSCASYGVADPTLVICASGPGTDSCQGDSGGPLVDASGATPVLVGIVSSGNGCADAAWPGIYTRVSGPVIRSFLGAAPVAPENLDQPSISGIPVVGETLTCAPGAWKHHDGPIETRFTRTAPGAAGPTVASNWGEARKLVLGPIDQGNVLRCEARATGPGGQTVAVSAPTAPITSPATPPADLTPTNREPERQPELPPLPPPDTTPPTVKIDTVRCTRKTCVLDVLATDALPGSGVRALEARVKTTYKRTCRKRGRRRTCTKTTSRRLTALPTGQGRFRIVAGSLRKGRHTFSLIGVDGKGNRQLHPTTVVKRTR